MKPILRGLSGLLLCLLVAGCGNSSTSKSSLWKEPAAADDMNSDPFERYGNALKDKQAVAPAIPAPVAAPAPAAAQTATSSAPAVAAPAPVTKAAQ